MKSFLSCNNFWALILASGSGNRMGQGVAKQFRPVLGKAMISYSFSIFAQDARIKGIMIATDSGEQTRLALDSGTFHLCPGGASRSESVYNGLCAIAQLDGSDPIVLVHDAARPCLHRADLDNCLRHLTENPDQPLILASRATDSIKQSSNDYVESSFERNIIWQAQTPQCARLSILREAMAGYKCSSTSRDDSWFLEQAGYRVRLLEACHANIKVTWPHDMVIAAALLDISCDHQGHSSDYLTSD